MAAVNGTITVISKFKIKQRFVEGMSIQGVHDQSNCKAKNVTGWEYELIPSDNMFWDNNKDNTKRWKTYSMLTKLNNKRESRHCFSYIF